MEPLLSREQYEFAVTEVIDGMAIYWTDLIWLLGFFCYAAFVLCTFYWVQGKRRLEGTSHQDKLDRCLGEMLKNRLSADTCPICLEAFNEDDGTGTDGLPLHYIRCGHSYCLSCWWSWKEKSANECETLRCLICRQHVKRS